MSLCLSSLPCELCACSCVYKSELYVHGRPISWSSMHYLTCSMSSTLNIICCESCSLDRLLNKTNCTMLSMHGTDYAHLIDAHIVVVNHLLSQHSACYPRHNSITALRLWGWTHCISCRRRERLIIRSVLISIVTDREKFDVAFG